MRATRPLANYSDVTRSKPLTDDKTGSFRDFRCSAALVDVHITPALEHFAGRLSRAIHSSPLLPLPLPSLF